MHFLLDEPESHFNRSGKAKAITRIFDQPTSGGTRSRARQAGRAQDCLLTTHSPFVPSDMHRNRVFIFFKEGGKVKYRHPEKTLGATFDTIIAIASR